MKAGGGKAKGSAFERKVCVALSLWISDGESEDLLWRSAMSGGRATVGGRKGKDLRRQAGDISAVSAEGCAITDVYYIECKHVKSLALDSFILKGTGPLANYWETAWQQAAKHGKKPMLIAKQNLLPTIVMTDPNDMPGYTLAIICDVCEVCLFDEMLKHKWDPEELP